MKRILAAFVNSMAGLKHGFQHEPALRQELLLLAVSVPIVPLVTLEPWKMLALWGSLLLILLAELLNTGIEAVADKVTREFAPEIKVAKDCGSAGVLVTNVIAAGVWSICIWERLA